MQIYDKNNTFINTGDTSITLENLVNHTGLDACYLSRQFKKEVGSTISKYIRFHKVETAKNMLVYPGYSVVQIASIVAFASQSNFSEIFKKQTGMTPLQYRKSHAWDIGLGQFNSEKNSSLSK